MAKPTRLSQEKLDDLLLKHRRERNKDLQDQHTIAQRNILVRKMKLARKLQAKQEAEAKKALLDTLSTDRPKPLNKSGMAAIASIETRKSAKRKPIDFQPGMVIVVPPDDTSNNLPVILPLSDPDLGEQFLKHNVPERLIERLSTEQPEDFDDPVLPTIQELGQESLSDEPPQT